MKIEFIYGGIGAGNVTKLCNQIVVAINIAAVGEALMLGKKAGKDLSNVMDAAKSVDSPTPLTVQVFEMMKILHGDGKGQDDHSALALVYEKMANTEITRR